MGVQLFARQVWTLTAKNLRIVFVRHYISTTIRAFVIPIILFAFFSYAKYLFVPPATFGISSLRPVLTLTEALQYADTTGRHTVALYNGGLAGGAIDAVLDDLEAQVTGAGSRAVRLDNATQLDSVCHSSLRGVTRCYGAVLFVASPTEGDGGIWKYDLRLDGSLGAGKVNVDATTNDGEVYALPFQHAIDAAIVAQASSGTGTGTGNGTGNALADADVHQYIFTSLTPAQRDDEIRVQFQSSISNFLAVAFISGVIGVCYHLTGFIATERESGMATLLDAMMATSEGGQRWGEAQIARLVSYHASFTLLYMPAWIVGAVIMARSAFAHSNTGVLIVHHILVGLALGSMSLFGSSFFRRSQLSGVSVTIIYLLLAIIAQTISYPTTGAVAVLSLLFAPCNYVYFITNVARFERHKWPVDLTVVPPTSSWHIPGIVLWVFLVVQIVVYPILGALIERHRFGTITAGRTIKNGLQNDDGHPPAALKLEAFSKTYYPGPLRSAVGFLKRAPAPVHAVRELTLSAVQGQILVLLGANGSGKSTTLDAIAGTTKLTSGSITLDGTGGLGIAPQKNVMWDELTVAEHLRIFNRLKSPHAHAPPDEIAALIRAIDLEAKGGARSKTLSGGQKRKLQLGMMLTGGSAVCCVDEVSSGIDPLSRRKIWDILLAERGRRTIVMTTHFLDEADILADHIAVLSKGTLRAEGSSVALKEQLGGGYRIHVHKTRAGDVVPKGAVAVHSDRDLPDVAGVAKKNAFDLVTYIAPSSALAAAAIRALEAAGVSDYRFSGPTLEDVFLQLAEEVQTEEEEEYEADKTDKTEKEKTEKEKKAGGLATPDVSEVLVGETPVAATEASSTVGADEDRPPKAGLRLLSGTRIGYWRQAQVLFRKRYTVFTGNWFPSFAALLIPVLAAGLVTLFIKGQRPVGCSAVEQQARNQAVNLASAGDSLFLVAGPAARFGDIGALTRLITPMYDIFDASERNGPKDNTSTIVADIFRNVTLASTFAEFNDLVVQWRRNVTPAGLWLGDASSPPTVAYLGDYLDQANAFYGQNLLDALVANVSIASNFGEFDTPWAPNTGKSLQLLVYVCLASAAYPGFFALYPNIERRHHVRALQYSNGVRALPLWLAYAAFDFLVVLLGSALVTALFAALSSIWYHVGYLFIVFALYGLASTLLAYLFALACANQLAAYAATAAYQAVLFLVYMIAYLCTITYAPVNHIDSALLVVHFVVSAVAPIGSVTRALFVTLNLFSVTCDGNDLNDNPAAITLYGGPILYLFLQIFVLFGLLLWFDSGNVGAAMHRLGRKLRRTPVPASPPHAVPDDAFLEPEDDADAAAAAAEPHGLRVAHLTKTYGRTTAVDNASFHVGRGEVYALLGPNGAGKSTTISAIRGDVRADAGDIFVEGLSISKKLVAARGRLGVCPQVDAVDQMTVREHLRFYARVRGIADVEHNVRAITKAVGLQAFRDRPAPALSGGNKRKLSLGIALMGNPAVVLLDEPSSGLDAAAKRIMWRTLAATAAGRSILLTTHSMEEADALAGRAGILATRMLASGHTDDLRHRFGRCLYVHLVCRGAPRTSDADTARVRAWVAATLPGADVESKTYHGQMRFAVPIDAVPGASPDETNEKAEKNEPGSFFPPSSAKSAIGRLVVLLDEHRVALGLDHYSVSPTTLDQVFLEIVGRHNVLEEGYHRAEAAEAAEAAHAKPTLRARFKKVLGTS